MDSILMSHMQFYAYHGVYPEEHKLGARYIVDLELGLSLSEAGRTDDLTRTVNYAEVYERVRAIVEGERHKLIEALAERLASDLLQTYTSINEAVVTVTKPDPPIPAAFDGVAVRIRRKRSDG
jgi:dihydroneopterin aldolase